MLPLDIVNDETLTQEALCAIVWLVHRPKDAVLRVAHIRKRFGWGAWIWRRVSLELQHRGVLRHARVNGKCNIELCAQPWVPQEVLKRDPWAASRA